MKLSKKNKIGLGIVTFMLLYIVSYAIGYKMSEGFEHETYSPKPTGERRQSIIQDKRIFYDDVKSNYCFEIINDTTFQLRCVCNCDTFKNRNK